MRRLGLERELVDATVYENTVVRFREAHIGLPTFAQLADASLIPGKVRAALEGVGPDDAHPLNLFRVNWYNDAARRGLASLPAHVVLPKALTGVDARIVVALGDRFPMIGAHKVLAAYGCLAPRVITGQFDPTRQRAIWPSTGNYCRGGVAISRMLGCRGVAVLPEGMSQERFDWLERWVVDASDIIRTPGTESNVKEIYDRCAELADDPENVIFNQFSEFGNHLVHYLATGTALQHVFDAMCEKEPALRLRAFVSATGSAGTIGAGDYLKEQYGSLTVAVEALECPTMLCNGFGEHNIQGIGDKHIPFIHNVMNTDVAVAVSDRATDRLGVLFNTEVGRAYLSRRRSVPSEGMDALPSMGLSSIANVLGAIKTAKYYDMGPDDVIVTVATDGAAMYGSERDLALGEVLRGRSTRWPPARSSASTCSARRPTTCSSSATRTGSGSSTSATSPGSSSKGMSIEEFRIRRNPGFWSDLPRIVTDWDRMIDEFNARTGVLEAL